MATVTVTNGPGADILKTALAELDKLEGQIGWFDTANYPTGDTPVAYIASIQEYGYGPIPPRMGLRTMIAKNKSKYGSIVERAARLIFDGGGTVYNMLEFIGGVVEGDIRKQIAHVYDPPLKDSTLKHRASALGIKFSELSATGSKPLVEPKREDGAQGLMLASVTHAVLPAGSNRE
jgi:hypothetical protein